LFINSCQEKDPAKNLEFPHYDIHLTVNPAASFIEVKGKLILPDISSDSIGFYLERNMEISNFTINDMQAKIDTAASDNRFVPEAHKIYFKGLKKNVKQNTETIEFQYKGKLSKLPDYYANGCNAEWVELGLYYPWFPISFNTYGKFTYHVTIDNVDEYQIFSLASVDVKEDHTTLSCTIPNTDIVVCMSKQHRIHSSSLGNSNLKIIHHDFKDTMLNHMSTSMKAIMSRYNQWYDTISMDISFIETLRENGGGYARVGGVISEQIKSDYYFEKVVGYHRFFAHEFAHLWWHQAEASTWHDWLNESFAEYSALMSIRETYGQEKYQKYIDYKREKSVNQPPIWEFDRNNAPYEVAYQVLYNKGPVILSELENKIGQEKYVKFCNVLAKKRVRDTYALLTVLSHQNGEETAQWLEKKLREV
jgi:hypothetical protein